MKPMMIWRITIRPLSNMKLFGLTRRGMLLILICLTRGALKMRTYPDFGLRIMGSYGRGCLYMPVGWRLMPAMVRSDEVDRILVLQSSTIRFWLREASDLLCAKSSWQVDPVFFQNPGQSTIRDSQAGRTASK